VVRTYGSVRGRALHQINAASPYSMYARHIYRAEGLKEAPVTHTSGKTTRRQGRHWQRWGPKEVEGGAWDLAQANRGWLIRWVTLRGMGKPDSWMTW